MSPKILVLLLAANLAVAQEVNPETKPDSTAAVTDSETVVLPAGQEIVLRSKQQIWSQNAKAGDALEFEVIKPVKVGELVVIAEGAVATGKVTRVQRPKSKGRGGIIGLTIDAVRLVTGEKLKTTAYDERNGGNHRKDDIAELILAGPLPGVGALLIPVALMLRGNDMMMVKGTRFTAVTDGAVSMKREAVASAQPTKVKSKDYAEVYLYRRGVPEAYSYLPITCGEQFVGMLEKSRFIYLKLPPGSYWLGAGVMEIRLKKVKKPEELSRLDVAAGNTYYLEFVTERAAEPKKGFVSKFVPVDEMTGVNAVTEMLAPGTSAVPPDIAMGPTTFRSYGFRKKCYRYDRLPLMQAQVGMDTKEIRKASIVEIECTPTDTSPLPIP